MKIRPILFLAVAVLLICVAAVWFLQTKPEAEPLPAEAPRSVPSITNSPAETPVSATPQTIARQPPALPKPPIPPPKPLEEWELKIDQALRANPDNSEAANTATAKVLINMLPTLPPDGQADAAQHISNLLLDQDYNAVLPLVKNPALPEEVLDVFLTDLLNREDAVKLPVLLEIAKISNHPHHEESMADLQVFLDVDHGTDWPKWEASLKAYLKTQAEEEARDAAALAPLAPAARSR